MTLMNYIFHYFDNNQAAFARVQGVKPAQVTQWVSGGFIVVEDRLYSPRRELNRE